uniref:Uncharacterized protein n=1 Tax=Caenorhabditis japonica TaxID=281687 RepID=A0A8R1EE14_CAEJA
MEGKKGTEKAQNSDAVNTEEPSSENAVSEEVRAYLDVIIDVIHFTHHQEEQEKLAAWYHSRINFLARNGWLMPDGILGPRQVHPNPGAEFDEKEKKNE